MTVNNPASHEAHPPSFNLATDVMGASTSKSKHLLRETSSEPPFITMSVTVIGALILLAGSQAIAQPAAERTANGSHSIQPQVFDFSFKNRQKTETKQLLQDARDAAAQGHAQKARKLIQQAAELPMNWELDEGSPETHLRGIGDRPSNAEARQSDRRLADIPTISELSEPDPEIDAQIEPNRGAFKHLSQGQKTISNAADVQNDDLTSRRKSRSGIGSSQVPGSARESASFSTSADQQTEMEQVNAGRHREYVVLHATSSAPSVSDVHGHDNAMTTSLDPTTNKSASNSEQTLVNLSTIVLSALFGAVVVLVGVLLFLLMKFGPNPTIVCKVEMTNTGREAEPTERSSPPSLRIAPIYAMRMKEEAEQEQQQEEAMMRKVFEDNLELREQLEASRDAA